jgi:hypothetical protein
MFPYKNPISLEQIQALLPLIWVKGNSIHTKRGQDNGNDDKLTHRDDAATPAGSGHAAFSARRGES